MCTDASKVPYQRWQSVLPQPHLGVAANLLKSAELRTGIPGEAGDAEALRGISKRETREIWTR